jgi:hypothetical protein
MLMLIRDDDALNATVAIKYLNSFAARRLKELSVRSLYPRGFPYLDLID